MCCGAQELELWGSCIKIMKFARYERADDVETAWDLFLKQTVEACGAAAAEARLRAACTETQDLAATLAPSRWCAPVAQHAGRARSPHPRGCSAIDSAP